MWKIYKWDGRYIMGDLVSKHSSEDAALKKAAKEINFTFAENNLVANNNLHFEQRLAA